MIILVRHAEKDVSPNAVKADPDLTSEGYLRAQKFYETIKKYNPQRIYSTNYRRTRFTVSPLADNILPKYRLMVEAYNPSEPEAFVQTLLNQTTKCIVVAGHSNTVPQLANLLLKQTKYKDLPDSEYGKIFIIKIDGKKIEETVIDY